MNVKFHKNYENKSQIRKKSYEKFSLVLLHITNFIYSIALEKCKKEFNIL